MKGNITLSPTIPVTDFFANIKEAVRQVLAEKPSTEDTVMTSREVMELCKISHVTLQKWRDENIIPFKKNGNKITYVKSKVLQVLK